MKRLNILIILLFLSSFCFSQKGWGYKLKSPDGKITVTIAAGKELTWAIMHEQTTVLWPSPLSLTLPGQVLGKNVEVLTSKPSSVDQSIASPIYKKSSIHDQYNQLLINFKKEYGVVFRAYND